MQQLSLQLDIPDNPIVELQKSLSGVIDGAVKVYCNKEGYPVDTERVNIADILWTIMCRSDNVDIEIVGNFYVFKVEARANKAFRIDMDYPWYEQDTETLTKIISIVTKEI